MQTIATIFLDCVTQHPDTIAAWAPDPGPIEDDQFFLSTLKPVTTEGPQGWTPATYGQIHVQVAGIAQRLHSLGVSRGTPVAIVANTSDRWTLVDMAIQCLGGITVGIYPTLLPEQISTQLEHSESAILLVEDAAQAQRLLPHTEDLFDLQHIFSLFPNQVVPQLTPARPDQQWLKQRIEEVQPEDVATYIYTSGTTGSPKAVVLRHSNFTAIIGASRERMGLRPGEQSIVFLPLSHVLQRFTQYRGLVDQIVGWFAPSINELPATLQVAQPEVMATVPRMMEKIRAKVEAQAQERGQEAHTILNWAIAVGHAVNDRTWSKQKVGWRLAAQHRLAERLVFSKIKAGLGGRLRLLICGGSALDPELALWFEAIGISVREGWGLSETSAPATANGTHDFRFGTVGKPLNGTDVRVAEDGELLVRGPGVFGGYLKDPQATQEAFTESGWFKTGDLGVIEDGFVRIVGRKKEIIVTAGGKNIAPTPIEQALEQGLVGQAVVIGDDKPYLIALLAPDPDAFQSAANANQWPGSLSDWVQNPAVIDQITEHVNAVNTRFPKHETIKKWMLLPSPLGESTGELTPTMKLKRRFINDKFSEEITNLYR
ncbi:MAG: AMP-dependent synthetase/ligase [Myxococcota bacterium]